MKVLISILIGLLIVGCGEEQLPEIDESITGNTMRPPNKNTQSSDTQNRTLTEEELDALALHMHKTDPYTIEEAKAFLKEAKVESSNGLGKLYKLGLTYSEDNFDVFLMELKGTQPTVVKCLNPYGSPARELSMLELLKWKDAKTKAEDINTTIAKSSKKLTEKDVFGTYESEAEHQRLVIRENGVVIVEEIDFLKEEMKWKIVGEEIHIIGNHVKFFMRIQNNGRLVRFSEVNAFGKRFDHPKPGVLDTFKKIK
jgi:hypothetical protein